MANKKQDIELCRVLPDLLNGLLKFCMIFAKKINDKQPLLNNEQWPVNWIGNQHVFMLL